MTALTNQELVIVDARDSVNLELTGGRQGQTYTSPPQTRGQALALVEMLLDGPAAPNPDDKWMRAAAGGTRTIRLLHP